MKNKISHLLLLSLCFLIAACGSEDKKEDEPLSFKDLITNPEKVKDRVNEMKEDAEELINTEPLKNENFKNWMPEKLGKLERSKYKTGTTAVVNIASLSAKYEDPDSDKYFKFELMDGAGGLGAGAITGIRYLLASNQEEETQSYHKRIVEHKGEKAYLETYKERELSKVQVLYNDRLYLQAEANTSSEDELWDLVDDLKVGKLIK